MRSLLLFSAVLLTVPAATLPQSESGEERSEAPVRVTISDSDWSSGLVLQHVLAEILESRLGLEVEFVPTELEGFTSEVDHSIDVSPEMWLPSLEMFWREHIIPGSSERIQVNAAPYAGYEGIYVPGYVQNEHDLRRVDQLRDPKIARLFDHDKDDLGEFWAGDPEWRAQAIQLIKSDSYGFSQHFEVLPWDVKTFLEHFREAYAERRPILFYGWEPSEFNASFDIRRLEEPPFDGYAAPRWPGDPNYVEGGCWSFVDPSEDPEWRSKSSIRCAYPEAEIWLTFRSDLQEKAPEAARFLKNLVVEPSILEAWIRLVYDFSISPEEMAEIWVRENFELVDDWLEAKAP